MPGEHKGLLVAEVKGNREKQERTFLIRLKVNLKGRLKTQDTSSTRTSGTKFKIK